MSSTVCNPVRRLSINELNKDLKDIKDNIIDLDDKYKNITKKKILKLLGVYTWENDYYIDKQKSGGKKNKKTKTKRFNKNKTIQQKQTNKTRKNRNHK